MSKMVLNSIVLVTVVTIWILPAWSGVDGQLMWIYNTFILNKCMLQKQAASVIFKVYNQRHIKRKLFCAMKCIHVF